MLLMAWNGREPPLSGCIVTVKKHTFRVAFAFVTQVEMQATPCRDEPWPISLLLHLRLCLGYKYWLPGAVFRGSRLYLGCR